MTGILDQFLSYSGINKALVNKSAPTKFCILIIQIMLKFGFISKYNLGGDRFSVCGHEGGRD